MEIRYTLESNVPNVTSFKGCSMQYRVNNQVLSCHFEDDCICDVVAQGDLWFWPSFWYFIVGSQNAVFEQRFSVM
jgi:hypothetical protein